MASLSSSAASAAPQTDPFAELRQHAGGRHPVKARLNVILQAITQVIFERRPAGPQSGAPPTPTEYFAALMTALEGGDLSSIEDVRHFFVSDKRVMDLSARPTRELTRLADSLFHSP